jgi:hypothetical protein
MVAMVRWLSASLVMLGTSLAMAVALADHSDEHKWLRSWIPVHCCVTNNCCFSIKANDAEPLPDDKWKIRATGQVLARTKWSPDGRFWRCACDRVEGKWVVHDKADTRCIFPPMQTVKAMTGPIVIAQ